MSDVNNNPLTAGIRWRQGTCLDSTEFTQYQAVKLSGPNTYVPCDGTGMSPDTDNDVAGIVLADRSPGQARSIPIALLSSDVPLPVLSDGSDVVTAGSASVGFLTLSDTVVGRFKGSATGTGCLRAVTSSAAVEDGLVIASGLSGSGGSAPPSSGYPDPTVTDDAVVTGDIDIDGTILNTLHVIDLDASATLAVTAPVDGETYQFQIENAGSFTITWPGTFLWPGGAAFVPTPNGVDMVVATYDGTNFLAVASAAFA